MHLFDHNNHYFHISENKELTSLYLSLGILHFGEGLISIFVPIYFFSQLGLPMWQIIAYYLFASIYFILSAGLLLPLMRRMSDKMLMFLGVIFLIIYYYALRALSADSLDFFYIIPAISSIGLVMFNVGYNVSFSGASDDKHMGREIGKRYIWAGVFTLIAPFLGGLIINLFGFGNVFIAGSTIMLLSTIPLIFFGKRNISNKLNTKSLTDIYKNKKLGYFHISSMGYAVEAMAARIVWPIFIFISIGSIEKFGGIISLSLFAGLITTYIVGRMSDHGKRRKVLKWSALIYAPIWITRAFISTAQLIVGSHIVGNIFKSSLLISWNSQYYKIAHALPQSSVFILSQEIIFNATRIIYLAILALLAYYLDLQSFLVSTFIITGFLVFLFLSANRLKQSELLEAK